MTSDKKPFFPAKLLNNNWPFSSALATKLFNNNIFNSYSSLRSFLIEIALTNRSIDSDDSDIEGYDFQCCLLDSNFKLQDNTLYYASTVKYEDSTKITDPDSDKSIVIFDYRLDHILYETIVCEAIRFHIKKCLKSAESGELSLVLVVPE